MSDGKTSQRSRESAPAVGADEKASIDWRIPFYGGVIERDAGWAGVDYAREDLSRFEYVVIINGQEYRRPLSAGRGPQELFAEILEEHAQRLKGQEKGCLERQEALQEEVEYEEEGHEQRAPGTPVPGSGAGPRAFERPFFVKGPDLSGHEPGSIVLLED